MAPSSINARRIARLLLLLIAVAFAATPAFGARPSSPSSSSSSSSSSSVSDDWTPLDAYLNQDEAVYGWHDTGVSYPTLTGGTAYAINVTSQTWLDRSKAGVVIDNGAARTNVWTHVVLVIVPKVVVTRNVSLAYLTGGSNKHPNVVPPADKPDVALIDRVATLTKAPAIVVFQLPNAPVVYPSDPTQAERTEDAIIAWAWRQYIDAKGRQGRGGGASDDELAEWLPRLPMVKGAYQAMRAAGDFMSERGIAEVEGWVVAGTSKRGWTTWMVGAARCVASWCPKVIAIAPLVPIVPNIIHDMHHMWKSYDGFTVEFIDYTSANITTYLDTAPFADIMQIVDPINYLDRLERLPKMPVMASNDEFMMFDWSPAWFDRLQGEKHLRIIPNTEHGLFSALMEVTDSLAAFVASVAAGITRRPTFSYDRSPSDGALTVRVPPGTAHGKVVMHYAQTMQNVRRDWRWIRQANNRTQPCDPPFVPTADPIDNCMQPIVWLDAVLEPSAPGVYTATPPPPMDGYWMGYFIEVTFPSDVDEGEGADMVFTTPGYVWPDTFPFADCTAASCIGQLV